MSTPKRPRTHYCHSPSCVIREEKETPRVVSTHIDPAGVRYSTLVCESCGHQWPAKGEVAHLPGYARAERERLSKIQPRGHQYRYRRSLRGKKGEG